MIRFACQILLAALAVGQLSAAWSRDAPASLRLVPGALGKLSLDHWPQSGWLVQQFENLVEIKFPGAPFDIDQTDVPGSGITGYVDEISFATDESGTFLRLRLSCDCTVSLQGTAETGLDITISGNVDLANGPAPNVSPLPVPRPVRTEEGEEQAAAPGQIDAARAREKLLAQLLRAADAGLVNLEPPVDSPDSATDGTASATAPTEQPASPSASPGQQEPNPPAPPPATMPQTVAETATQDPVTPVDAGDPPTESSAPDLAVADEPTDTASPAQMAEQSLPEQKCHANEVFSFELPGSPAESVKRIADLRSGLVGEFDKPEPEKALELAKLYIGLGLAPEARAIVTTFAPASPLSPLHLEMAQLFDGHPLPSTAVLMTDDCLGDQALWRAYAHALAGESDQALQAERSAGRALERAPIELRERIAGRIGLAAADIGDWSVARRMEAMAHRAGTAKIMEAPETLLLTARVARWHGENDKAIASLHDLRRRRVELSAEALLMFAEMVVSGEAMLHDDARALRTDLGALAREREGTTIGKRAFDLEVRLADMFDSRQEAIDLLALGVDAGRISPDAFVGDVTGLVSRAVSEDGSRPLALIYLDDPDRLAPALEQRAFRRAVALSMAEIGTPALSRPILRDGDLTDPILAQNLAEAFLAADDPREALDIAGYLPEGAAKRRITAAAMLATGQDGKALAHLGAATPDDDPAMIKARARIALATGDWEAAVTALEQQLALTPEPIIASQLAMAAMQAGHETLPTAAEDVLSEADPERLAWFKALFGQTSPEALIANPSAVAGFLESLDAETAAIQEILNDG